MKQYIYPNSEQLFAFNIWNIESAKAVMDASSKLHRNVILQTSIKSFQMLDQKELRSFVDSYEKRVGIRAFLHLDHCKQMDHIQRAVDCGWDSVMIDASDRSIEENINITKEVCSIAKEKGVLVEAEVGQIKGQEEEEHPAEEGIAKLSDVRQMLSYTDIDMLAVAVGTSHGVYHGKPKIHFELLENIAQISKIPLVIHGGTGLEKTALLRLLSIQSVKKINISTDVKLAYRKGIEEGIQQGELEKEGFDPLKICQRIHNSIEDMVMEKIALLGEGKRDGEKDNSGFKYGNEEHPKYSI